MPRKKRKEEKEFMEFTVSSIAAAPSHLHAVFFDPEDDDWVYYPVIVFAVGVATVMKGGDPVNKVDGVVRGMISDHGGLELAEETQDLEFIGYWREDSQEEFDEFLKDHGIDKVPGEGTKKPTVHDDDDDDDEDDE